MKKSNSAPAKSTSKLVSNSNAIGLKFKKKFKQAQKNKKDYEEWKKMSSEMTNPRVEMLQKCITL